MNRFRIFFGGCYATAIACCTASVKRRGCCTRSSTSQVTRQHGDKIAQISGALKAAMYGCWNDYHDDHNDHDDHGDEDL